MRSARGFTIIELLIAVSLVLILTTALIPSFSNYIKTQNIRQAQEQIKGDLRAAENKALTEYLIQGTTMKYWGVKFPVNNSTSYTFFTSDAANATKCNSPDNLQGNSSTLPGGVTVKLNSLTDPACVFFSVENGDAVVVKGSTVTTDCTISSDNCRIVVDQLSISTNCKYSVAVNAGGLISVFNGSFVCQ